MWMVKNCLIAKWSGIKIPFEYQTNIWNQTSEYRPSKSILFRCFRFSDLRYSDPNIIYLFSKLIFSVIRDLNSELWGFVKWWCFGAFGLVFGICNKIGTQYLCWHGVPAVLRWYFNWGQQQYSQDRYWQAIYRSDLVLGDSPFYNMVNTLMAHAIKYIIV